MKKKSKKTKREPRCKKCYLYSCHFCGSVLDNRGWAIVWANKKNGPEHHMCGSCAE